MTTFNTAFKNAYSEALKPYGFVKLKGRYPYFVKLVDETILQIITWDTEWSLNPYHSFNIGCDIATIYRPYMNFSTSSRANSNWISGNHRSIIRFFSKKENGASFKQDSPFVYEKNNEASMITSIDQSIKTTIQDVIPILESVNNLRVCMDYFRKAHQGYKLNLYPEREMNRITEGFINLKLYDSVKQFEDEMTLFFGNELDDLLLKMNNNRSGFNKDDYSRIEKKLQENLKEQVSYFDMYLHNPMVHEKAIQEMNKRKKNNIETLRKAGFTIMEAHE